MQGRSQITLGANVAAVAPAWQWRKAHCMRCSIEFSLQVAFPQLDSSAHLRHVGSAVVDGGTPETVPVMWLSKRSMTAARPRAQRGAWRMFAGRRVKSGR